MQKSRVTAVVLILSGALGLSAFATRVGASSVAQVVSPPAVPLEGTFWQAVVVGDRQISLFAGAKCENNREPGTESRRFCEDHRIALTELILMKALPYAGKEKSCRR